MDAEEYFRQPRQLPTRIVDKDGRLFIYRTNRVPWLMDMLPEIGRLVEIFCRTAMSDADERVGHNRGSHNFSIMGFDRNNKKVAPIQVVL